MREIDDPHAAPAMSVAAASRRLRGRRFAESLDLEGAFRLSKYSIVGTTGTWKLGGTWSPIRGLLLRAMRSRSVRVPNFGELYEVPVQRQAGSITDPCEAADYHQSETRSANCRALGILVPLAFSAAGHAAPGNSDEVIARVNLFNYGGALVGAGLEAGVGDDGGGAGHGGGLARVVAADHEGGGDPDPDGEHAGGGHEADVGWTHC